MYSETLEFTHRRGLTIATSILAVFWGVLCLMILSMMLWPANLDEAVAAVGFVSFMCCVLVVALHCSLWRLFSTFRVDETGLERIRFGRITHLAFDSVVRIELGHRWRDAWIDIHTPESAVRITSDLTDYARLFDLLFDRFPQLRHHEEVSLPYTVWMPRFYSPIFILSGFCSLIGGVMLLLLTTAPLWPLQGILSAACGFISFMALCRMPSRYIFTVKCVFVVNRLQRRVYPLAQLRGVHLSRVLTLDFGNNKLHLGQSMIDVPLFLLYRILHRAYQDILSNKESDFPSRASGDIG